MIHGRIVGTVLILAGIVTASGVASLGSPVQAGATSAWTVSSSPDTGTGSTLSEVSCVSPTSCTAVGGRYNATGAYRTLIESWNGTAWTVSTSRNPGPGGDTL